MPQSTARSYLGIAKESTYGTAVAATNFVPVSGVTPKDNVTLIQDQGWRGSMVDEYGETAGPISAELDFSGDVFTDTIGFPLAGILGDIASTGTAAPYSHVISVLNSGNGQPSSYTINDNYAAGNRRYAGAKFSEVQISFAADGVLTHSTKAMTLGSAPTTAPTPSFSPIGQLPGWTGVMSINGSTVSGVTDGEVDIKRSVTVINAVDGSQTPLYLWSGTVAVTGKATLIMEDDTFLTQYLTNAQPSISVAFSQGTGASLTQISFQMSKCALQSADITRGKDYVEIPVAWNCVANVTDKGASGGYSPLKVTIQNAVNAGTY